LRATIRPVRVVTTTGEAPLDWQTGFRDNRKHATTQAGNLPANNTRIRGDKRNKHSRKHATVDLGEILDRTIQPYRRNLLLVAGIVPFGILMALTVFGDVLAALVSNPASALPLFPFSLSCRICCR
jgi:hypothetical protein